MPYEKFDVSRIELEPIANRENLTSLSDVRSLNDPVPEFDSPALAQVADRVRSAHSKGKQVVMMMGAHVIKVGMSRYVIDLMERGIVTHVALNGAGMIHDFELAMIGGTAESVPQNIKNGRFGMWRETSELNEIAKSAAEQNIGLGEAVGRVAIGFRYADVSILAAGVRLGVPVTVHVAIGQDIVHEHPNCDGAAIGKATYNDFLIFTNTISKLEGGAMLCFGTAVMGPEVYLKALSMVRNVARRTGESIAHFTTAVFDIIALPEDITKEASKTEAAYYYRPWKTILIRTVADGGESFYVQGDHRVTVPNLWKLVTSRSEGADG